MINQLEKAMLLRTERYVQMRSFWEEQIGKLEPDTAAVKGGGTAGHSAVLRIQLEEQLSSRLLKVSRGDQFSLFALLITSLQLSAQFFWDTRSFAVATPLLGGIASERTLGQLALIVRSGEEESSFVDYAKLMKELLTDCYQNQDYPIEDLWQECYGRRLSQDDIRFAVRLDQLHDPFPEHLCGALALNVSLVQEKIMVEASYDGVSIETFVLNSFLDCWQHGLTEILAAPQKIVKDTTFLSVKMIEDTRFYCDNEPGIATGVTSDMKMEANLADQFRAVAALSPQRSAVWSFKGTLSYCELDERSDQIAAAIQGNGVKPGTIIALGADRTVEAIVGIIGILKAGCAYLPIDPEWPEQRIHDILTDSMTPMIVIAGRPVPGTEELIRLEAGMPFAKLQDYKPTILLADSLAYVLYTSGSTGKPKGVMIEHRNVINLVQGLQRKLLEKYDPCRLACVAPLYFDASVQQIFSALLLGHTLYVVPDEVRLNGEALWEFFEEHAITVSDGTPMHLQMLSLAGMRRPVRNLALQLLLIGGEALSANVVQQFLDVCGASPTQITNVYGPTECCVDATAYSINASMASKLPVVVPIGKPLLNQSVYIMDKNMQLRPMGAPGELYIGGLNVGRGYLNGKESTSERFIFDPNGGGRLYRTGDLARWLPNGNIDFLGRVDFQIKIKGYRIELGEIEQVMFSHKDVTAAAAVIVGQEVEDRALAVYFTGTRSLTEAVIREHLRSRLPNYMLPTHIVQVDKFPMMSNGKIARKQLPPPDIRPDDIQLAIKPSNGLESVIWEAWQRVLGRNGWSVDDSFFLFGGDSLKALRLMIELGDCGINVKLHEIFQNPTIRGIASVWTAKYKNTSDNRSGTTSMLEKLLLDSGITVQTAEITIDGESKTVWYIDDMNEEEGRKLLERVKPQFLVQAWPHYVLPARAKEKDWVLRQADPLRMLAASRIIQDCLQDNETYARAVISFPIVHQFPAAPIQRAFLESAAHHSGTIIPIDSILGEDKIRKAISAVIEEQALLRCELKCEGDQVLWVEHKGEEPILVPYRDLSPFSPVEQQSVLADLTSRMFYDPYMAGQSSLLYRIVLMKLNEREYHLILACHHAVYDEMSGELIGKQIMERIVEGEPGKHQILKQLSHYGDYVEQVNKGPKLNEKEIVTAFALDKYDQCAGALYEWLANETDGRLRTCRVEFSFQPHHKQLAAEGVFDASLRILEQVCRSQGWTDHLPLLLFHYGRRYEQSSFFDTAGLFIDVMPFTLVECMEAPSTRITEQLKHLSEYNINFASFLFGQSQSIVNQGLARFLHPSRHAGIWFNYHGRVETTKMKLHHKIQRPKQTEKDNLDGNQLFGGPAISVDISYTDAIYRLTLTCPFSLLSEEITAIIENTFSALTLAPAEVG